MRAAKNATMGEPSGSLFYCLVIKKLKNALSHFAALFMPSKTYTHELASGEDKGRRKEQFERNERILIWRDSGRIKRTTTNIVKHLIQNKKNNDNIIWEKDITDLLLY